MSITVTLNKKDHIYPEQERAGVITNASQVPSGKTKMLISDVKSDSNSFSVAINFFSKGKGDSDKVEIISIVSENAVRSFSNGMGYAHLDTKDNREISLKYNGTDTFDYYYITLNPNTIHSEHQITLNVDFD